MAPLASGLNRGGRCSQATACTGGGQLLQFLRARESPSIPQLSCPFLFEFLDLLPQQSFSLFMPHRLQTIATCFAVRRTMPSFAPSNGSSTCYIISSQPDDCETECRECKKAIL